MFWFNGVVACILVAIGALLRVMGDGGSLEDVNIEQHKPPLDPTTTRQQDITAAGQRKINLIWEYTQAIVTVMVVAANIVVAVSNGITGRGLNEHPQVLSYAMFIIIGFYYSRTNHAAIGGIGPQPLQEYKGR